MPTTSPRRRLPIMLSVGALVALSALAMPTAASAAEVCTPTTTPTAETLPWQTFAQSPNQFDLVEAAYEGVLPVISAQLGTVDADFTQVEYDAMYTATTGAYFAAGTAADDAITALGAQRQALLDGLAVADPTHIAENDAILAGWGDAIANSQFGTTVDSAFTNYLAELGNYLVLVQDAITANTPRPTVPASFTSASAALGTALDGVGAFVQVNLYDAAAARVIFTQTCTTAQRTLPATGATIDGVSISVAATFLLLLGAGLVGSSRRVRSA